jgi:hypothetical protein
MPKYRITVDRTVEADNRLDALSQFTARPFALDATAQIVELYDADSDIDAVARAAVETAGAVKTSTAAPARIEDEAPLCPDHQMAMQQKPSKFHKGEFFWSCPAKNVSAQLGRPAASRGEGPATERRASRRL